MAFVLLLVTPLYAQITPTSLNTIIVTSTRAQETLREVSSNVTVYTEQDLKNSTAIDFGQFLKQQGFYWVDYGSNQFIQIRGMHTNTDVDSEDQARVLFLLNGHRAGIAYINQIGFDNIERVEIIRGPSAIQYGASAMGGVINIITKRGKQDTFTGSLHAGIGSFNLRKYSAAFSGGYGGLDFSGSATNLKRGDYNVTGNQRYYGSSIKRKFTSDVDLGYTFLENHRIGVNYNYSDSYVRNPSGWASNSPSVTGTPYVFRNRTFTVSYDGKAASGILDWSLLYSSSEQFKRALSTWWQNAHSTTKDLVGRIGYRSQYIDADIGFENIDIDFDNETSYSGKSGNTSKNLGFWLTAKVKLLEDSLIFSAAGRYDRFEMHSNVLQTRDFSKTRFSPSIGVAYIPLEWLKFRANFATGFMMPTASQMAGPGTNYVPNPDLKPEESVTWEIGVDVNWQYISSSLTFFSTDWKDKIIGNRPVPDQPGKFFYTNLKDSTISGIEFVFNFDIGMALNWDFSLRPYFTLNYMTELKNKDPDIFYVGYRDLVPTVPKYTYTFGVSYVHEAYDLSANINGAYYGGALQYDTRGSYPYNNFIYVAGITAVDFTLQKGLYKFGDNGDKGKLTLNVAANNIFDDRNENYLNYLGPGRNFYVGLTYEF
jgi:vitamin B12 transporter